MQLSEIRRIAQHQDDHWVSRQGFIDTVDITEGLIEVDGVEYKLVDNSKREVLGILGLNGTAREFEDDPKFLQMAVRRKNGDLNREYQVIYDETNDQAKGIKGTGYQMISNIDVLDKSMSRYGDNFDPRHSNINDNSMEISFSGIQNIPIPSKRSVGDIVSFGTRAWNGITTSLGVGQLLERLACTNGMLSREKMDVVRMAHNQHELMMRLEEGLVSIMKNDSMLNVMARAVDRPAIVRRLDAPDGHKAWGDLLTRYRIPRRHHEGIFRAHRAEEVGVDEDGVNGWGVYNAATRYNSHEHRDLSTYDFHESMAIMTNAYSLLTL